MLVYKYDSNILPFAGEGFEGAFDGGGVGFGVDDEVVLLRVGGVGYVLIPYISTLDSCERGGDVRRRLRAGCRSLSPRCIDVRDEWAGMVRRFLRESILHRQSRPRTRGPCRRTFLEPCLLHLLA